MKVLISVTHLLGAGHLSRALTLGRAYLAAGHTVTILSGGRPAPHMDFAGIDLVQLPSVASDGTNFSRLLDDAGHEATEQTFEARKPLAIATLHRLQPDVLLTELFPFGRRSLSDEFLALLDAAHAMPNRPRVLCSIRDILAPPSKPKKAEKACQILTTYYDGVLVHSDPTITQLSASWPVTDAIAPLLHYTGYVAPPAASPHPDGAGQGEVLVSAGGGSVGQAMFECVIEAARQSDLHWHILVGGADRDTRIAALKHKAGDLDITIEAVRPDFRQMLYCAAASLSMCGYNTALDLLQTGIPSVLVPFDDGGEVEQTLRSASLAEQPAIEVLPTADMTPARMAELVAKVIGQGPRSGNGAAMDGAAEAVRITETLVNAA